MKTYNIRAALLVTACLAALSAPAFAQTVPGTNTPAPGSATPGRVEDQFQTPKFKSDLVPQVNIPEVRYEGAPDGADRITFVLQDLNIDGVTAYTPAELRTVYAGDVGKTISLARLYDLAASLTRKYRNDGYIITQVIVPAQTIQSGVVRLQVVEGSIDQVTVEGDTKGSARIQELADNLKHEKPLTARGLERQLLLINDLPGVTARSVISPSATQTGRADIRIIVERDPIEYLIGADNYGSRYLGPVQLTGAVQVNNPAGLNDKINLQTVVVPEDDELYYGYAAWTVPLNSYGTNLTLDLSHADTEPGYDLEMFDFEGYSTTYGAQVDHSFIRTRNENLSGRVRFDWRRATTRSDLGFSTEDEIRSLRLGGRYEMLSTLLGVSINTFDIQASKGLGVFGASDENDSTLSRADGDPQYTKIEGEYQRLQRLGSDFNILLGVKGQLASNALLSSEEFGIGGMDYGRGYEPSEIVGDDGISGKLELQWNKPLFQTTLSSSQLFAFYDVGSVWNKDATTSADKRNSIASTGIGARTTIGDSLTVDALVALPLTADVSTAEDKDPRFFIGTTKRF